MMGGMNLDQLWPQMTSDGDGLVLEPWKDRDLGLEVRCLRWGSCLGKRCRYGDQRQKRKSEREDEGYAVMKKEPLLLLQVVMEALIPTQNPLEETRDLREDETAAEEETSRFAEICLVRA